jgi:PAS domain S-box-containing protein
MERTGRDDLERRRRSLRRVANSSALLTVAISLVVLLLWTTHLRSADATLPFLFEMKVNTALGFGAAGIALYLLERERPLVAARVALAPILIGLVTLVEYLVRLDIPFDQLLIRDWSAQAELLPGRPSPNSAIALIGLGAATIALVKARPSPARRIIVKFICFAVIAIGMAAIAGYIADSAFAIGWGTLRKMALPTATCSIAMGAGLMAYSWQSETVAIARIPVWIPALLAFAIVLFDVSTPLEINAGICYVPLVFCALWFERPHVAIIFAAISTLLILFGFFASPRGAVALWAVELNRSLDILAVWVVALLVYLQRRATRDLERGARHLASAQELAEVGSFELDLGRMRFKPSVQFDTMYGLAPMPIRDWSEFARATLPPDDRAAIEAIFAAARRGEELRDLDYSFLRADGAARNAIMHCETLANGAGGSAMLVGVVRDVTELRQAEARQADIESQLRHAQKMEALGVVAGSVAHDLNNTLMPITTLVPFMIEEAGDAEHKRSLEIIIRSGRRARELVREILTFSRKEEPGQEPLRLDLLARDTLTILRAGIPTSIAIVDALEPVPEILGTRGQLYQTILNLATNAAQAIGDKGGSITIVVCPGGGEESPCVHLSVADGAGMDEATRARIFEPFFSTKTESAGTGLGLAIVSGIVARHHGTIAVESAPGRGTRFDLVFPAADGESAREAA